MENITVTVSGSAGSGKSTVCNMIEAALSEKGLVVAVNKLDHPDHTRDAFTDPKRPVSVIVVEKQEPRRSVS